MRPLSEDFFGQISLFLFKCTCMRMWLASTFKERSNWLETTSSREDIHSGRIFKLNWYQNWRLIKLNMLMIKYGGNPTLRKLMPFKEILSAKSIFLL